jgi:hypothetical protein
MTSDELAVAVEFLSSRMIQIVRKGCAPHAVFRTTCILNFWNSGYYGSQVKFDLSLVRPLTLAFAA